jgi:hypothetical protein
LNITSVSGAIVDAAGNTTTYALSPPVNPFPAGQNLADRRQIVVDNAAPSDIQISAATVAENQPAGTAVGTLSTTDASPADTYTYLLVGGPTANNNSAFTIAGSTLKTAASFNYEASNSYRIRVRSTDQAGLSLEKEFTLTVTDVNDTPSDMALSNASVAENQPVGTTVGNCSTTDEDPTDTHTYTLVPGTGATDNTSFTFDGNKLETAASFDCETKNSYSIRVRTTDQGGLWFEKSFTILVNNVNEVPSIAAPDSFTVTEDVASPLAGIVFSDVDASAGSLSATLTVGRGTLSVADDVGGGLIASQIAGNGTSQVVLNGSLAALNATLAAGNGLTYLTTINDNTNRTLTLSLNDNGNTGTGSPLSAQFVRTIHITSANDLPVAVADTYTLRRDASLAIGAAFGALANDYDADGDPLRAALVTGASHGTLLLSADGSFRYTPEAGWTGTDIFTYVANDNFADSLPAVVNLVVEDPSSRPLSEPEAFVLQQDKELSVPVPGVLGNDLDPLGGVLTAAVVTNPAHGTVTMQADGSFTYTPAAGYFGADHFTYRASNAGGMGNEAVVSLTLQQAYRAPVVTQPIPAQTSVYGTNFTFTCAAGTFTGMDQQPLLYSSKCLPPGLAFDPATRTISGTSTQAGVYLAAVVAYAAATPSFTAEAWFTFTIQKAPLTVTATDKFRSYGEDNPALTCSYAGLVNSDDVAVIDTPPVLSTTAVKSSPVNTYKITPSGGVDDNYAFTYVEGTLTVNAAALTITAHATNRAYGAVNPPLTGTLSGVVSGDDITGLYTTAATVTSPVGTYDIVPTFSDPGSKLGNYSLTTNHALLAITQAALLVTANDTNRLYGSANPVFTASYSGWLNGDTTNVLGGSPFLTTPATVDSAVGGYPIQAALGTLSATNYSFAFTNGTLTVNAAALTITAHATNRLYGTTNPTFTGTLSGIVNGDAITGIYTMAATVASPVGTYDIVPTFSDPGGKLGNYSLTTNHALLTITQAALLVTADDTNRLYGATSPVFTATYSGWLNDDTMAVLSGAPVLTTTATVASVVGGYPIEAALGTLSATNYSFAFTNGTLTVNAAALTITAHSTNRLYGTTNPTFTGTLSGIVNGDAITGIYTTAATIDSPVGTYDIVPGFSDPGGKLGNYSLTLSNGTLTVNAGALRIATNATFVRTPGMSLKIPIALIAWDTNGQPVTVQSAGPSVQGASLDWNATYLFYRLGTNLSDSFPCRVSNGTQTATTTITVSVLPTSGSLAKDISVTNGTVTVKFFGIPGLSYDVQRTANLATPDSWATLTSTPLAPGADGSFIYTDTNAPLGTAFYRCVRH